MPFVDDSFLPNEKSLGRKSTKVKQWRRPHDIKSDAGSGVPWVVFRDPRPTDIAQGVLGNCWFVCFHFLFIINCCTRHINTHTLFLHKKIRFFDKTGLS